jgi:hypothetical protein
MAKLILNVCDTCNDKDKPVKNYRIVSEGRTKDTDLCEEHGAPIEAFMEGTRSRGGARGGRRNRAVDVAPTGADKVKQPA